MAINSTLERLLMLNALAGGNNPSLPDITAPARPVVAAGPLQPANVPQPPLVGAPEPAPGAPLPRLDEELIGRYVAQSGPAPTPPPPASRLQRIAAALVGFGEGAAGRGAEYLYQLREPQRRYESQLADYNQRRSQLGAAGLEAAERKRERQQESAQRRADAQAERDFNLYLRQTGITDEVAVAHLKQGFELAQIRERERAADERLFNQQKLKFGEDLGAQIRFYRSNGVETVAQARRLALNDFADTAVQFGYVVPDLVRADDRVLAKVGAQVARLHRLSGGAAAVGGGARIRAAAKAVADFESIKAAAIAASGRGDIRNEKAQRRRLDVALGRLQQFSDLVESGPGEGGWPYQKSRGQSLPVGTQPQPMTQQAGPTITLEQLRVLASQENPPISLEEAARRAQAQGVTIRQQ